MADKTTEEKINAVFEAAKEVNLETLDNYHTVDEIKEKLTERIKHKLSK